MLHVREGLHCTAFGNLGLALKVDWASHAKASLQELSVILAKSGTHHVGFRSHCAYRKSSYESIVANLLEAEGMVPADLVRLINEEDVVVTDGKPETFRADDGNMVGRAEVDSEVLLILSL